MSVVLVHDHGGDWVALYRDGRLVAQGHSFEAGELLKLVDVQVETIYADAEQTGFRFPTLITDVVA